MTSEFDTDTAVEEAGQGRYTAHLSERWGAGPALNGGYGLAIAARAIGRSLPQPDPVSVTAHFLGPLEAGPAAVAVSVPKQGRSLSTGEAQVSQGGRERLRALALFAELPRDPSPLLTDGAPPYLPAPDDCVGNEPGVPNAYGLAIGDRFMYRVPPEPAGPAVGEPTGKAVSRAWVRFVDDREPDLLAVLCIVDAFPPVVREVGVEGWTPTLELTVHLRAHPAPGWLRVAIRTRFVQGGMFEEDTEVWDEAGTLVGQSRQLARLPA